MQKETAENLLQQNHLAYKSKIAEKQHTSNLQTKGYQEKNKKILSEFLKLTN